MRSRIAGGANLRQITGPSRESAAKSLALDSDRGRPTGTGVTSPTVAPADASLAARLWQRPLGQHALALTLLLLALLPWLGSSRLFSADEGAVQAQAHVLAEGDGWFVDHVRPELHPDGSLFLLHNSAPDGDRSAPFAKHPAYAVALAPLEAVGGKPAMVLTSILGTVLAALAAGLLARRLRPGTERWALWAVGLASPAFLYGYVLIAHTLGAALAGLAVYLAVRDRPGWRDPVGVVAALAVCVTLRSEAVLLGLGLAAACVLAAWLHRRPRFLLLSGAAFAGAVVGQVLDQWLADLVASGQGAVNPTAGSGGTWLSDRVFATVLTWLLPSYDGLGADDLLLLGTCLFGVATIVIARRRPDDAEGLKLFATLAAACAVARLAIPAGQTPGLLIAFPLLAAGLVALDRKRLARDPAATIAAATFGLYALAVLATQYREGGSGEWGGRYFLLGLPVIVPVVLAALADLGERLDAEVRRHLVAAAAVGSLAMAASAGLALYEKQWLGQTGVDGLEAMAQAHPDAAVIVTDGNAGRRAWRHAVAGDEWFLSEGEDGLPELADALAAEGRTLVVATQDEDEVRAILEPQYTLSERRLPRDSVQRAVLVFTPA